MKLDNVTLLCIDDLNPCMAHELLYDLNKTIKFESTKLFCSDFDSEFSIKTPPMKHYGEYDRFVIKELYKYIDTEFCLIVQRDGFFVNPNSWNDEYFSYDYIGAPWPNGGVGNGGFSFRSRSLLEFIANHELSQNPYYDFTPEDGLICSDFHQDLIKAGHTFAPYEVAVKFSVEGEFLVEEETFGFHGRHTFNFNKYNQENKIFKHIKIYHQ